MEDLFRFVQIRSAYREPAELNPVDLTARTPFQQAASTVVGPVDLMSQRKALATAFSSTGHFLTGQTRGDFVDRMVAVGDVIQKKLRARGYSRNGLVAAIDKHLGGTIAAFVADPQTLADLTDLKDSVIVVKLLPTEHRRPIHRMVDALRVHGVVEQLDTAQAFGANAVEVAEWMRRPVALPAWVTLRPPMLPTKGSRIEVLGELRKLAIQHERLDAAIKELLSIRPSGYRSTAQVASRGHLPPEGLRPAALFAQETALRQKALDATLLSAGMTAASPPSDLGKLSGGLPSILRATRHFQLDQLTPHPPGVNTSRFARVAISGRSAFTPRTALEGLRLEPVTISRMSGKTKKVLAKLGLDSGDPVNQIVASLMAARRRVHEAAQRLALPHMRGRATKRIGNYIVSRPNSWQTDVVRSSPQELLTLMSGLVAAQAPVPLSHANIKPVGLMDLLLVRQQLTGYERAEIAHVENVLKSEVRDRTHRKRLDTESTVMFEAERETDTESALDTTDRFEMRREAQAALQEQTDVKGSLTVSGTYGPSVEFQASGEASWSRRADEGTRSASETAREVTRRASERVSDRVLRRETRRTLVQVEDADQHKFDNTAGQADAIGVYQWLSKVYEAQVFNYGQRVLYDLTIPEPGALLLEAFRISRREAIEIIEPPPFETRPGDLAEDNYQGLVTLYGATGVKPPPEPFRTESYDFNTGGEDKDQEFTNSTRVPIPEGYAAFEASVGIAVTVWDDWSADFVVGNRFHRFDSSTSWVWTTGLDGETGAIPLALTTDQVGDIAVAVEVRCQATERAMQLWQAETHSQLTDAYRARVSEYEAKLSALESQAPAELPSRSSYRNHDLIVDEIKRLCVSVLSEQHFDLFDAVDEGAYGLPQLDFEQAGDEGAYARFFEQALEWENVAWATYSYFWGRKEHWAERLALQDSDIDFEDFLKAGAIRVVIPVRTGFEAAMDHFRLFGEPWLGGALPTVSDPTYLPIADELAARLGRPGAEVAQGDPWEVRVPTDLVLLRPAADLPIWQKQPNGSWAPAN